MTMQDLTSKFTKIAVVGSGGYSDYAHFESWIKYYTQNKDNICFVSGGAKSGADNLIERYANENNIAIIIHYPDYSFGRRAPITRNVHIVHESDMMIAFWDGKSSGTANVLGLAKDKGIPIRIVTI